MNAATLTFARSNGRPRRFAFDNVMLFGAANPVSRPHHWASTTVPGTSSVASGVPPSDPVAKAFMSIV